MKHKQSKNTYQKNRADLWFINLDETCVKQFWNNKIRKYENTKQELHIIKIQKLSIFVEFWKIMKFQLGAFTVLTLLHENMNLFQELGARTGVTSGTSKISLHVCNVSRKNNWTAGSLPMKAENSCLSFASP